MSSVEVLEVLKWIGELERRTTSAEFAALPKILLSWCLKTCFRFRETCFLHLSPEYNRNQVLPDAGHANHRNEEICVLHSQQWRHIQLVQTRLYISTVSFDKTSIRPLHLDQALALPPDDIIRRLKKPELYLWTAIRVEMSALITKFHSDYQHTSILTHANSTTISI